MKDEFVVTTSDQILVTGANGFIGTRVIEALLRLGFSNIRCFVRPSGNMERLDRIINRTQHATVRVVRGNLLSREDCRSAVEASRVIIQ